jgi:hypothetical protein
MGLRQEHFSEIPVWCVTHREGRRPLGGLLSLGEGVEAAGVSGGGDPGRARSQRVRPEYSGRWLRSLNHLPLGALPQTPEICRFGPAA